MFEWLKNLFLGTKSKIQAIAERIKRFMDRFEVTRDEKNYLLSKKYYNLILYSKTLEEARHYEQEFYNLLKQAGILTKNYEEAREYSDEDYHSGNISFTSSDDSSAALYTYTQTSSENFSGEGGEFGGAGASASWEETTSDNS